MTRYADLHTHTYHSDGTRSPREVIDVAASHGLSIVSISDHDNLAAYFEIKTYADAKGITLVPGIELSCGWEGVDVHVLLSERTDSRWVDAAGRTYADVLLGQGVKIHFYGPPMVHAKTILVDRDVAIVGTANFDNRSLRLNFEVMAVMYDEGINQELAASFTKDLAHARQLHVRDTKRPFAERLFEATARLLSPQL